MNNKLIFVVIAFVTTFSPINSFSQVNDTLKNICDNIKLVDYAESETIMRSRDYSIQINRDTLFIELIEKDSVLNTTRSWPRSRYSYKASVSAIGEIKFISETHQVTPDFSYIESKVGIYALREYPLFAKSFDMKNGERRTMKSGWIPIKIIRQKDTTYFKEIVQILNNEIDTERNSIEPSCEYEQFFEPENPKLEVLAIFSSNLDEPVKLNGKENYNEALTEIWGKYLRKQNIQKFYGSVIVHESDKFESLGSYQNYMYNELIAADSLSLSDKIMSVSAHSEITNKHIKKMTKLIKKQQWEAGSCEDKKVKSFIEFSILNPDYVAPEVPRFN